LRSDMLKKLKNIELFFFAQKKQQNR